MRRCLGHVGGTGEEGAQRARRAELEGEAKTVVVAPALADQCQVFVVEVEEADELLGRGLTGVAPVGATLLSGEEPYGHIGFAVAGVVALG